jgi:hypothetical protein
VIDFMQRSERTFDKMAALDSVLLSYNPGPDLLS